MYTSAGPPRGGGGTRHLISPVLAAEDVMILLLLQVWGMIADKTRPVLQAVPLLRVPIDFVRRAFDNPH